MDTVLIYPNQLFYNHPALSRKRRIVLVQDPLFFGDETYPVAFHKQKILLHLLSIENYGKELEQRGYDTTIINYDNCKGKDYMSNLFRDLNISKVFLAEVVDCILKKRIMNAAHSFGIQVKWYESSGFLLSESEVQNDFQNKKTHFMAKFYKKQRRRFNILIESDGNPTGGKWSYDTENRKKLPRVIDIPEIKMNSYNKDSLSRAQILIDKSFQNNPGQYKSFNYPISRKQALESFNNFLHERFSLFGKYEDAISKENTFLFHSLLTPYLNIGLITPKEIIDLTLSFAEENKTPLNSLEGFLRQIIGWREFIRGIYTVNGVKQRNSNFWGFKDDIPNSFYTGTTGLQPLDTTISRCLEYGYSHHIERLMVLGNIMVLSSFTPGSVYKWFMEHFIDAYDWVMVPNVYGMSQFSDGGLMSTKPYISGSNYLLKMSDYKKDNWCNTWDALYWEFINKHRKFFQKNHRTSMMVSMYDKKNKDTRKGYAFSAKNYHESIKIC